MDTFLFSSIGLRYSLSIQVEVPLMRQGNKQRIATLINEETLLLAKYLRGECKNWIPRVVLART